MKIIIAAPYRYLEKELRSIPQRFDKGEGELVYDGRNTLRRFLFQGKPVMVKRFKRVNPAQQIAYTFFCKTKAERAFFYAREFRRRGISTPEEVAYIELWEHGLFTVGYFVSQVCPDPPVFPVLVPSEDYNKQLATDIAAEIAALHQAGILHGDLNLGNFLYHKTKTGYSFTVVDINRSHLMDKQPDEDACLKNLSTVTERPDLFRFIAEAYIQCRGWENRKTELIAKAVFYWEAKLRYLHRRRKLKQRIRNFFNRKR